MCRPLVFRLCPVVCASGVLPGLLRVVVKTPIRSGWVGWHRLVHMAAKHVWTRLAGLSGASSIGLAAYGAHGLKVDATLQKTFENGNRCAANASVPC